MIAAFRADWPRILGYSLTVATAVALYALWTTKANPLGVGFDAGWCFGLGWCAAKADR